MKIPWEKEAEIALNAVSTGGELTLDRPSRLGTATKESYRDIVTEVDVRVEAHLSRILGRTQHPIVGEESFSQDDRTDLPKGTPFWAIDPIDGTANYVSGLPYYGVSVGLCKDADFLLGAISLPALKELYFTYGDHSAFLNGKAIRAGADSSLKSSLIAGAFSGVKGDPSHRARQYQLFGRINDASRGVLRLGSAAYNLCNVAAGKLQACYGIRNQIWDVAAGLAIAKQAGYSIVFRLHPNSTRVDYIAGCPTAVAEIHELCVAEELTSL